MPWRLKASELEYFSYNRDGGKSIDAVVAAQEADDLFIFLRVGQKPNFFVQILQSSNAIYHLVKIVLEDICERRFRKFDGTQPCNMFLRQMTASRINIAVTGKEF